jgi:hypothetical protein
MNKETKAIEENPRIIDQTIGSAQEAEGLIVELKKSITPATQNILLSIVLFLALLENVTKAEEKHEPIEKAAPTSEVIIKNWSATFPVGFLSTGPIGCTIESFERVCRIDGKQVASYSYSNISSTGFGSQITNINPDGTCIIVHYRLSVDHKGAEGRTCLEPYARLKIELKLTAQ